MISKTKTILFASLFIVLWIVSMSFVYDMFVVTDYGGGRTYTKAGLFLFTVIITPLWEELFYRHIPLQFVKEVNEYSGRDFTTLMVLLSSIIFGISHDNGIFSILLQGVGGVVLCLVYIKNGYSYWSSVIVHVIWNTFALYFLK